MTRALRGLALALVAAVAACSLGSPPAPTLESVSPDRTQIGTATAVSIRGTGFAPRVRADLDRAGASSADPFALALVREGQRVPLEEIVLVSDRELTARVPPVATPAAYDLELADPRGRTAVLPAAFTVEPIPGCGPDGTPCDDGNVCTQDDTCHAGACTPGAFVCASVAPRACLSVTPAVAAVGGAISFDASCSSVDDAPASALRARFDLDGDGVFDTDLAPISVVREAAFPAPGVWAASVEVVEPGGLSDVAFRYVVVSADGDRVVVTTAADEADPGATPAAPGGTGLSLREAIAYVNGLAAPRTIDVAVAEPIVHATALPALVAPSAAIVSTPAAPLEFGATQGSCVTLDGPDQLLLGATVTGCAVDAVQLAPHSDRARVAECTIAPARGALGISAKASGWIGPRNAISGAGAAIRLSGLGYVVEENVLLGNDEGVSVVAGVDVTVRRNRIAASWGAGLRATPSSSVCTLVHNVFDANGGDGADVAGFAGGVGAWNNLFTHNGGVGLRTGAAQVTADHNGFFANAGGPASPGAPGSTDSTADPRYAGDHRLAPGSPAIDRGSLDADASLDLNGPAVGRWNGAAPDLGAWESPYPPAP